jgi:UDP-N-acetyl-D-glucosamine 4,6-dehydratase
MRKASFVRWIRTKAVRIFIFLAADAGVFALSLYLAFLVRFDGHIAPRYLSILLAVLPLAVVVKIVVSAFFRMYRFSWAYVGIDELVQTVLSCTGGSLAFAGVLFALRHWPAAAGVPRSILGVDFAFSLLGIAGIRFFKRVLSHTLYGHGETQKGKRALIVGGVTLGRSWCGRCKRRKGARSCRSDLWMMIRASRGS